MFGRERGQRLRRCNLIWWMIELGKRTKIMFRSYIRPSVGKFHHIRYVLYWVSCLRLVYQLVCLGSLGSFTGGDFAQIVLLMYLHIYLLLSKARKALH